MSRVLHSPGVGRHDLGEHRELSMVAAPHYPEVEHPVPLGHQADLLEVLGPVAGLEHHGAPGEGVGAASL